VNDVINLRVLAPHNLSSADILRVDEIGRLSADHRFDNNVDVLDWRHPVIELGL
jgi:hypothetical protein